MTGRGARTRAGRGARRAALRSCSRSALRLVAATVAGLMTRVSAGSPAAARAPERGPACCCNTSVTLEKSLRSVPRAWFIARVRRGPWRPVSTRSDVRVTASKARTFHHGLVKATGIGENVPVVHPSLHRGAFDPRTFVKFQASRATSSASHSCAIDGCAARRKTLSARRSPSPFTIAPASWAISAPAA
jgi:hypothetical protein